VGSSRRGWRAHWSAEVNGAAFLAGVVEGCLEAYSGAFATRRFINPYRLLIGRAAIDVAFTLDHADERLDADRHLRTVASAIPLHCIAVDVDTALAEDLTGLQTEEDLRCALLASSRMPWVGGGPVEFRGRRWLDGGLAQAIPHRVAARLGGDARVGADDAAVRGLTHAAAAACQRDHRAPAAQAQPSPRCPAPLPCL
jgi:predicted patatin/cPLA2 family phospholipase